MILRESVVRLCLNCRDGNNTNDILGDAASGEVVDRSCDTLRNRAVSLCLGKTLNELVADVTCVKIREYKYVSLACNVAARSLRSTYGRNHSGVCLKLAVQKDVRGFKRKRGQ